MIELKTSDQIQLMLEGGQILADIVRQMAEKVLPGQTTLALDSFARSKIAQLGLKPSFEGYKGYPHVSCLSVNSVLVHGKPDNRKLKTQDTIGIDLGLFYHGLALDHALTVSVGQPSVEFARLLRATKKSLKAGISQAVPGGSIGKIARAIQTVVEQAGYHCARELTGHGLGREIHQDPRVPNFTGTSWDKINLKVGMVLAIEPMVVTKPAKMKTGQDGWSIIPDRPDVLTCHVEHSVAITKNGPLVLTKSPLL